MRSRFVFRSPVPASVDSSFAWHCRLGAFERLSPHLFSLWGLREWVACPRPTTTSFQNEPGPWAWHPFSHLNPRHRLLLETTGDRGWFAVGFSKVSLR
jgi:hypothetical protein